MDRAVRVYRHISRPILVAGIELMDLAGLLIVFQLVFLVSDRLVLNLSVLAACYAALRWFKKGRAERFGKDVIRFVLRPGAYHVARFCREDEKESAGTGNSLRTRPREELVVPDGQGGILPNDPTERKEKP